MLVFSAQYVEVKMKIQKTISTGVALAIFSFPALADTQREYTAQQIANGGGVVYKKELRQKVVQGPTMTKRDVGDGNIGYVLWGYMSSSGPYFRLVGLPYGIMRDVDSVRFVDINVKPQFTPQKRLGNVQIGFGSDVYRKGLTSGLTVSLSGDVKKTFHVPSEYFQGFNAWWRKTYP
jgi:hypothetical protein